MSLVISLRRSESLNSSSELNRSSIHHAVQFSKTVALCGAAGKTTTASTVRQPVGATSFDNLLATQNKPPDTSRRPATGRHFGLSYLRAPSREPRLSDEVCILRNIMLPQALLLVNASPASSHFLSAASTALLPRGSQYSSTPPEEDKAEVKKRGPRLSRRALEPADTLRMGLRACPGRHAPRRQH